MLPRSVHSVTETGVALSSHALALNEYPVTGISPVDSQLSAPKDGGSEVDAVTFWHSYLVEASFVPAPHAAVMDDEVIFMNGLASGGW
jgi:hypothetical protein